MDDLTMENYAESRNDLFERIQPYIGSIAERARVFTMISDERFTDSEIFTKLILGCMNNPEEIADYLSKYELTDKGLTVKRPFLIEP